MTTEATKKKKKRRPKPAVMALGSPMHPSRVNARLALILAWQDLSQEEQRTYRDHASTLLETLREVRP